MCPSFHLLQKFKYMPLLSLYSLIINPHRKSCASLRLCFQVSGSKIWQTERSCMCCQESGEREATVALFCPRAAYDEPKVRKVSRVNFKQKPLKLFTCLFLVDHQSPCRVHVPALHCSRGGKLSNK